MSVLENSLTVQQAADLSKVSTRTIKRWITTGLLPAHRIGPKLIRVDQTDLEKLNKLIRRAS